jgi:hypothetical protein
VRQFVLHFLSTTMGNKDVDAANYGMVKKLDDYEFGGPVGVLALMIWSHYIVLYFW